MTHFWCVGAASAMKNTVHQCDVRVCLTGRRGSVNYGSKSLLQVPASSVETRFHHSRSKDAHVLIVRLYL